jgi:hypothetical protein
LSSICTVFEMGGLPAELRQSFMNCVGAIVLKAG